MNCSQARAAMHLEMDHELDRDGREQLTAHIVSCQACRLEYDQLSAVATGLEWLAHRTDDVVEVPPQPVRSLLVWGRVLAAAAVIALSALWLTRPIPTVTTPPTAPRQAHVQLSTATDARFIAVRREPIAPRVHVVWLYPVHRTVARESSEVRSTKNQPLLKRS